ncbi:TPA: NAD(P)/FAD-dependent oxidoreductase [Thermoplasmata archaeon]|nr:NAD(P)/FAD-dependent oxidoreductase [Thermoplasmata archaeon]
MKERGASPFIVMRSAPTCLPLLLERAAARGIEVNDDCLLERVDETPHGLEVVCSGRKPFKCNLVVVAHGREPRLEALSPELIQSVRGSGGRYPETTTEGLFVVGDVVRGKRRQTAIAAGDGVHAAMKAIEFLRGRGARA